MALGPVLSLPSLPQEIFDHVVDSLGPRDKLALYRTSKAVHALVEEPLYSSVVLRWKTRADTFACVMAARPDLRRLVKHLSLVANAGSVDPDFFGVSLDKYTALRSLKFEPSHHVSQQSPAVSMIKKLVAGQAICSLTSLHVRLCYSEPYSIVLRDGERLLRAIFANRSIESLTFSYQRAMYAMYTYGAIEVFPVSPVSPLGPLEETKFTNLKDLDLRWDGQPLSHLSTLLQLPRYLEKLTLTFSLKYDHTWRAAETTLNATLEPVAGSLQKLVLDLVEDGSTTPEGMGLRWSTDGLLKFENLRLLSRPALFFSERHGIGGKVPWLPPLLTDLQVTKARTCFTRDRRYRTLDPTTLDALDCICRGDLLPPSLKCIRVWTVKLLVSGSQWVRPMSCVQVRKGSQALIDRGMRLVYKDPNKHTQVEIEMQVGPESMLFRDDE